jgi:hypothetical protein
MTARGTRYWPDNKTDRTEQLTHEKTYMSTEIVNLNIKSEKFANSNSKLEEKIALITGGNSSIGLATASASVVNRRTPWHG